jgi:Tol biopolymer transport system component
MAAESNAAYAPPGYLLFHRENALYAQPFDWKKQALRGEPARVADELDFTAMNGYGDFTVAADGSLLYFKESDTPGVGKDGSALAGAYWWRLAWSDRSAKVLATQGPDGPYVGFDVSPDGKRIAVHRHDEGGGDILVIEPDNSVKKLTFDASHHNSSPVWSPAGDRVAYSALERGKWGIYQTLSSGSGTEELLYESDLPKAPMSWSPDGKNIVFWVDNPRTAGDLWVLTMEERKARPLIATNFDETHAQISPDGKWIAYTSNLTGRNEIHVQPFPSGSGHWQVSFHGGDWPRWRGDGKELFYHSIALNPDMPALPAAFMGTLFSVAVSAAGGEFVAGNPNDLVRNIVDNVPHGGGIYQTYAVSRDGQRILNIQYAGAGPATAGQGAAAGIKPDPGGEFVVARNWVQGLKK